MPDDLADKLVIDLTSSALFDFDESDAIFSTNGPKHTGDFRIFFDDLKIHLEPAENSLPFCSYSIRDFKPLYAYTQR